MADWYLAPSLVALRTETNRKWPDRDKASDGSVGDPAHSARKSDHNPDRSAGGVVRAIDIDKDGIDVTELLEAVVRDPRVAYVIWNRRIASATDDGKPWDWEPYNGPNPHDKHLHISIKHTRAAENDTSPWFAAAPAPNPTEEDVFMAVTPEQLKTILRDVINEQRAADDRYEAQAAAWRIAGDKYAEKLAADGKSPTEIKDALFQFFRPLWEQGR